VLLVAAAFTAYQFGAHGSNGKTAVAGMAPSHAPTTTQTIDAWATTSPTATATVTATRTFQSPTPTVTVSATPTMTVTASPSPTGFAVTSVSIKEFAYVSMASSQAQVEVSVTTNGPKLVLLTLTFTGSNKAGVAGENAPLANTFKLEGQTAYTVNDTVDGTQFCFTKFLGVTATTEPYAGASAFQQLIAPAC
jgi:hypothetical protein